MKKVIRIMSTVLQYAITALLAVFTVSAFMMLFPAGIVMLFVAFLVAAFMTASSPSWLMYLMFCLAGIAWASINVNSFPMVVEMCSDGDVGKYTGYYYTASMAAQTLTPMVSGRLMDNMGLNVLFPYAAIFVAGSFVTMLFVKHGDVKPIAKKGLEALDVDA